MTRREKVRRESVDMYVVWEGVEWEQSESYGNESKSEIGEG